VLGRSPQPVCHCQPQRPAGDRGAALPQPLLIFARMLPPAGPVHAADAALLPVHAMPQASAELDRMLCAAALASADPAPPHSYEQLQLSLARMLRCCTKHTSPSGTGTSDEPCFENSTVSPFATVICGAGRLPHEGLRH